MEETNNRKMNFFVRVYKSITNFDTYTQFASEPISKAIKYFLILVLIFSIIVTIVYVGSFKSKASEGAKYLRENIEDINFNNKKFSYNNDEYSIYNEEGNIVPIIIVDTSDEPNIEEYKNKVKLYKFGFILLKDDIIIFISTEGIDNQFTTMSYSDYGIENMSKDEILDTFNSPTLYIILAIMMFFIEFVEYAIYILLNAIALAVMGQLISIILRLRMKFSETYKMGLYALTLPTLLDLIYIIVNNITGFVIPYFSWMYTTISYIYICVAILMIKTDFINMQKQLIKIQMEERKEEEQEKIEEKPPKDEDKEDEKEEESDENNDLKEQTDS